MSKIKILVLLTLSTLMFACAEDYQGDLTVYGDSLNISTEADGVKQFYSDKDVNISIKANQLSTTLTIKNANASTEASIKFDSNLVKGTKTNFYSSSPELFEGHNFTSIEGIAIDTNERAAEVDAKGKTASCDNVIDRSYAITFGNETNKVAEFISKPKTVCK